MTIENKDILRGVFEGTLLSTIQVRNVFTAQYNGMGGYPDDSAVDDWQAYLDSVYSPIQTLLVNTMIANQYVIYHLVLGHWEPIGTIDPAVNFTNTGDAYAPGVAAVVTALAAGVRRYGRKFFPGLSESLITSGYLTAAAVTAFASAGLAYVTPFGLAGDFIPGVYNEMAASFKPFLGEAIARAIPGYQRRRKQGVGI